MVPWRILRAGDGQMGKSHVIGRVRKFAKAYWKRRPLDLAFSNTDPEHALTRYLLYYLVPLWTAAGALDWTMHKRTDIEHTAGARESLLHLLMFTEAGVPLVAGLFLEVNAGLLAAMLAAFVLHEATAFWDVTFATDRRLIKPNEQHLHSLLEALPLMAISMAAALHGDQIQSMLGIGRKRADWKLRMKNKRVPGSYLVAVAGLISCGVMLPYGNELLRCWRARKEPRYRNNCGPAGPPAHP